ncbi:hypothetical protein [Pseudoduganella namucuonensis]|uniref:hypothetical protein n=1 Tax=Pseudoduganella namucuonensis TaxID=1035707 RepID=UPI0011604580|nr:hypothetical protein [Pseudoduganella namucuonensis]
MSRPATGVQRSLHTPPPATDQGSTKASACADEIRCHTPASAIDTQTGAGGVDALDTIMSASTSAPPRVQVQTVSLAQPMHQDQDARLFHCGARWHGRHGQVRKSDIAAEAGI